MLQQGHRIFSKNSTKIQHKSLLNHMVVNSRVHGDKTEYKLRLIGLAVSDT